MPVTMTASGPNSAIIEYTAGSSYATILTEIQTFLEGHGQESVDSGFWTDGQLRNIMTYRALNKDGITYKYMQIYFYNTTDKGFVCRVFETYNDVSQTFTNLAFNSDNYTLHHQECDPSTQNGRLHVFASERYFMMFNLGTAIGSGDGNGAVGCFEVSKANDGDNTPMHCWINTYFATSGRYISNSYANNYIACFPRTAKYTGSSAGVYTRFSTPIGDQGGGVNSGTSNAYYGMSYAIPSNPPPFGTTVKHHVFDIMVSCDENANRYVKGKLYGLKAFTTNIGANGDVFRVKCNDDMFLSSTGNDLDHFIISHASKGTFGIPL